MRAVHPGAAHVCWAMLAGGQSAAVDDGEPGGTAGRPMLEVLRHQDLDGVLATVVRYFGGIKLGAGGLLRAYTEAVAQALRAPSRCPCSACRPCAAQVAYELEGMLRREAALAGGALLHCRSSSMVRFHLSLPQAQAMSFRSRFDDLTQGRVTW